MRILLLTGILGVIVGCAPPVAPVAEKFIPKPELSAVALANTALAELAQGKYLEAELGFRRALYLHPNAENIRRNLAVSLLRGGQPEAAEEEYRAMIAASGENSALLANLAQAVMQQGRNEEAATIYESLYSRAIERGDLTTHVSAAVSLSTIYFKLGREEDALCRIEEAFVARPDAETARRFGSLLLALNHPDRARAVVEPILKAREPDPGLLYVRALAAFAEGDIEATLDSTSRALALGVGEDNGPVRELRLLHALVAPTTEATGDSSPPQSVSLLAQEFGEPTPRWLYLPPQFLQALEAARQTSAG